MVVNFRNHMMGITYESLKAEQAWIIVSEQLQHRNALLGRSIYQLEQHPEELPTASRLLILRYHLRHSLRQLARETRRLKQRSPAQSAPTQQLRQQWLHVHQLFFLLCQIDTELKTAESDSLVLRTWLCSIQPKVYKPTLNSLN